MQSIQRVSMIGVAVGAMALVVVLSAFNGLEDLVRSFYNRFDPDLKVQPLQGKRFAPDAQLLQDLRAMPEVAAVAEILEEKVFLRYGERESIAMMKEYLEDEYQKEMAIRASAEASLRKLEKQPYNKRVVLLEKQKKYQKSLVHQNYLLELLRHLLCGQMSLTNIFAVCGLQKLSPALQKFLIQ